MTGKLNVYIHIHVGVLRNVCVYNKYMYVYILIVLSCEAYPTTIIV